MDNGAREAFEQWVTDDGRLPHMAQFNEDTGQYQHLAPIAWIAWEEAWNRRASLQSGSNSDGVKERLEHEFNDADELLKLLGLDPIRYRTECGFINMKKIRAALKDPALYAVSDPQKQSLHDLSETSAALGGYTPEEDQKDAARYRWLRSATDQWGIEVIGTFDNNVIEPLRFEQLDTTIDAAIASQQTPGTNKEGE